jgi:rhombotail lipoprotein
MRIAVAALCVVSLLAGCAPFGALLCTPNCVAHTRTSSSLVEFLYPDGNALPAQDSVPRLPVPLRVGLAFLPSRSAGSAEGPTAAQKEELLERIRQRFLSRKFVAEITIIPDYYLGGVRGFAGLEGVQRLYGVDVMALVSYDQITHSDELRLRSLAYLTILGAFIVSGSEHDVSTLVDLAVVDPKTRSLVLRAGGTDTRHMSSTLMDQPHELRSNAAQSFSAATDATIDHFDVGLSRLEADIRAGSARVQVVNKDGSARGGGGGGDFGVLGALLLSAPLALRLSGRRRLRRRT